MPVGKAGYQTLGIIAFNNDFYTCRISLNVVYDVTSYA